MELKEFFEENRKIALGFSGGVDSSYLLYAATKYGADVKAYYVKTQFQPAFELADAKRLAEDIGVAITILDYDVLQHEEICANPPNRCYYCKKRIFGLIREKALEDGYTTIIDGTNASDDPNDRPGMKALFEFGVLSPLRECGLTKQDIRLLSKEAGLFTWNKASYSCLATRITQEDKITEERLERVEKAESILFKMGFTDFRVRMHGKEARIQFKEEEMERAFAMRREIYDSLKDGFENIGMDLQGR